MGEDRAKRLPNPAAVESRDRPCLDSALTYCVTQASVLPFRSFVSSLWEMRWACLHDGWVD